MTSSQKNKIGLFFGSFNPVHTGHLIIANHIVEYTDLDEVWFVVTPHNPIKERKTLLADHHRLMMLKEVVESDSRFEVSDIEFKLSKPSYTIHSLEALREKCPDRNFVLIMGSDNIKTFHKWKNSSLILDNYEIYVYPRPHYDVPEKYVEKVTIIEDAPLMQISSSYIRKSIALNKKIDYLLPPQVRKYVEEMSFYRDSSL